MSRGVTGQIVIMLELIVLLKFRSDGYPAIPRVQRTALDPLYYQQVNPSLFPATVLTIKMVHSTVS